MLHSGCLGHFAEAEGSLPDISCFPVVKQLVRFGYGTPFILQVGPGQHSSASADCPFPLPRLALRRDVLADTVEVQYGWLKVSWLS